MRLIRGRNGWWCIAVAGTALIPDELVRDGALTNDGHAEVERLGILRPRPLDYYSLTVLTSTSCNLGCPYCFQNTGAAAPGKFNPPRIQRVALGAQVIDSTVAFTRARMAQMGVSRLYVLLFGGEPLLNPLGCRMVLERCGELGGVTGAMISNGVLLRKRLAVQLHAAGLRSVQITLDGPREIHDSVRTTRNGGATFDKILANVAAAQESTDIRFTIRINLTPSALAGMEDLVDKVAATVDASRCGFGITPVLDYGWGFDDLINPSRLSSAKILDAYALAQERGFAISRPSHRYCAFCSDERGKFGAVVNADGTLFSCWESVGRSGYEVGTVTEGYRDYAPDNWVACGSFADPTDAPHSTATFTEEIEAGLLDLIRDRRRRLEPRIPQRSGR